MLLYTLGFRSVHASSRTCQDSLRHARECKRLSDRIQMRETTRNSSLVWCESQSPQWRWHAVEWIQEPGVQTLLRKRASQILDYHTTSCSLLFTWPRKLGISLDCLTLSQHQANLKPAKRSSMVRLALPLAVQSSASFQHVALKKSPFGTRMPCCFCQLVQVPYGTTRFCWLKDQINREDDTLRIGMGTGWWTFPKVLASETKWDQNIDGDVLKERALVFERFCGVFYAVPGFYHFIYLC